LTWEHLNKGHDSLKSAATVKETARMKNKASLELKSALPPGVIHEALPK